MLLRSRFPDLFGFPTLPASILCLCLLFAAGTSAWPREIAASGTPVFTILVNFDGTNGDSPGLLVQGTDGNFYGPASGGGPDNLGTIFKMTPAGALTTLYSFHSTDNAYPVGWLVQATNGNFYGTTSGAEDAGPHNSGSVFEMTPAGKLSTLHSFDGADGSFPTAGLVQATNGNFYGTTDCGVNCNSASGTVFEITGAGKLTTLHSFDGPDGSFPMGGLVQATNGNFYGTTVSGGASNNCPLGCGTVFEITAAGKLTTLYSFCAETNCTDGSSPEARLVQAANGNFYGTTVAGGTSSNCPAGCGTVFEITGAGKLTTLHSFDNTDGVAPIAGLVQGTDGNFYGTTYEGGSNGDGTVFEITPGGKLTTLHSFDGTDGVNPTIGLIQGTNGDFYGSTAGSIFSLSVGLGPFVETRPTSGAVGAAVEILGNDFMCVKSVTFNGTPAEFKVVSGSEITTGVPDSATSGKVEVKTSSGTLTSNVEFRVTQ